MKQRVNQTEAVNNKTDVSEDEIELIDLLKVIWKWKYLIFIGAVVSGLIAAVASYSQTKINRISMTVEPAILNITGSGKIIYSFYPKDLRMLIQSGTLDNDILKLISIKNEKRKIPSLKFIVLGPKRTTDLKIIYDAENVDLGIEILNALLKAISRNASEVVNIYRNNYIENIENVESEIKILEKKEDLYRFSFNRIQKNIIELETNINMLISEIDHLKEKKEFLPGQPRGNNEINSLIGSFNLRHLQNLNYNYSIQIRNQQKSLMNMEINLFASQEKIGEKKKQLIKLNEKKNNLKVIDIIEPPLASQKPINQRIKSNTVFATMAGFILFLFLAFFLEKLLRFKKNPVIQKAPVSKKNAYSLSGSDKGA